MHVSDGVADRQVPRSVIPRCQDDLGVREVLEVLQPIEGKRIVNRGVYVVLGNKICKLLKDYIRE